MGRDPGKKDANCVINYEEKKKNKKIEVDLAAASRESFHLQHEGLLAKM